MRLPDKAFWQGRRVFVTGHTGFKGSWLAFWLHRLGADVVGYALPPETKPSLFALLDLDKRISSRFGDVRDAQALTTAVRDARAEVVLHLAAQPLVLRGYREPVSTFETNIMGTVHLLEAVRRTEGIRATVVVTSDKVYAEEAEGQGFVESDRLGGPDPYSASKACAELVSSAYRDAFLRTSGIPIATVRAGNVIGGGDWSEDRLIPDIVAALRVGDPLALRHPHATRPWQHVLDPLAAYLVLAERLAAGEDVGQAWNIGPDAGSLATVAEVVSLFERAWGGSAVRSTAASAFREAPRLVLDARAARAVLDWTPRLDLEAAIYFTAEWYRGHLDGAPVTALTAEQIERYTAIVPRHTHAHA